MVQGAVSIAEHVHRVAERYPVYVALHTDHCQADKLEKSVLPLVEETERRRAAGKPNLFCSHMFDGSALPLKENLDIAVELLERFRRNDLILEIEAGGVGGEEDGIKASAAAKLYTTPEDTLEVARRLNVVQGARYLLAATFGNVHGVYEPGQVYDGVLKVDGDVGQKKTMTRAPTWRWPRRPGTATSASSCGTGSSSTSSGSAWRSA
jgi:fructose-bisphosphate aldolase class II